MANIPQTQVLGGRPKTLTKRIKEEKLIQNVSLRFHCLSFDLKLIEQGGVLASQTLELNGNVASLYRAVEEDVISG